MVEEIRELWEAFIECLDRICKETKGEVLFLRLRRLLISRAKHYLKGHTAIEADVVADSVLQEVIWNENFPQIGVYEALKRIENPMSYLYHVLRKRCIDRNRKERLKLELSEEKNQEVMKLSSPKKQNEDWPEIYQSILSRFSQIEQDIWNARANGNSIDGMAFFDEDGKKYGRVKIENVIKKIRSEIRNRKEEFLS